MQSIVAALADTANAGNARLLSPPVDEPLPERQMAELREAWLEHQVHPPGKIESRGVAYSALND
jgi:hypothetical protein